MLYRPNPEYGSDNNNSNQPGRMQTSTPPPRNPTLVPPILSISASTPLTGESPQPVQYFVPTHKPTPAIVPPPVGLNLSSFGFMLMEKRDREREATERANRTFLRGEGAFRESGSGAAAATTDLPSRTASPAHEDARSHVRAPLSARQEGPSQHAPYSAYEQHNQGYQQPFGYQGPPGQGQGYPEYGHYPPVSHHPSHYHSSGSTNIGMTDRSQVQLSQ